MNQSEIYTLAKSVGLSDQRAKIAAAIAMAESGGNANSVTDDSDDYSFGLWQINMKGSMGPVRRAAYNLKSDSDLLNPLTNAKVMSSISHQGQNFNAWTTYTGGRYKSFLSNTVQEVPGFTGTVAAGAAAVVDAVPGWMNTVAQAGATLTATTKWVSNPSNWVRVAYIIGGIALVYAGVETLVLPYTSKAVGTVMGVAAPVGKAVKKIGAPS